MQSGLAVKLDPFDRLEPFLSFKDDPNIMDLIIFDGDGVVAGAVVEDVIGESEVVGNDCGGDFPGIHFFIGQDISVVDLDNEVDHALEELGVEPGGIEDEVEIVGGCGVKGDRECTPLIIPANLVAVGGDLGYCQFESIGGVLHFHFELPHLKQPVVLDVDQLVAEDAGRGFGVEEQKLILG